MGLAVAPPVLPDAEDSPGSGAVVLDTNIVLDLLVFDDPATHSLRRALDTGAVQWITSTAMRDELERVLGYRRVQPHLLARGRTLADVLATFDRLSQTVATPSVAAVRCSDPDDQVFIDLAVERQASLWSKDMAVLCLRTRLAGLGVRVRAA